MTTSCPNCGSGDIHYDPCFGSATCCNCGQEFPVKDYDPEWEVPFDVEKVDTPIRDGKPYGRYSVK